MRRLVRHTRKQLYSLFVVSASDVTCGADRRVEPEVDEPGTAENRTRARANHRVAAVAQRVERLQSVMLGWLWRADARRVQVFLQNGSVAGERKMR